MKKNQPKKNVKLHIYKTISYRFLATITTITGTYLIGLSIEASALIGVGEIVVKPVLYFLHERIWDRSNYLNK
jgi:uncharacterized membrane protein